MTEQLKTSDFNALNPSQKTAFLVLATLLIFAPMAVYMAIDDWKRQADRYPPGQRGFLSVQLYGTTNDRESRERLDLAEKIADHYGVDELAAQHKTAFLARGTEILVTEAGGLLTPSSRTVRVLSGAYSGTKWIIQDLALTASPVGDSSSASSGATHIPDEPPPESSSDPYTPAQHKRRKELGLEK